MKSPFRCVLEGLFAVTSARHKRSVNLVEVNTSSEIVKIWV